MSETERTAAERRFRRAAWAYALYGLVYLCGAVYLQLAGLAERAGSHGLSFFVMGAAFVIVLPPLVARGHRSVVLLWLARLLAVGVGLKAFFVARFVADPRWPTVPTPLFGDVSARLAGVVFLGFVLAAFAGLGIASWRRLPPRGPAPDTGGVASDGTNEWRDSLASP